MTTPNGQNRYKSNSNDYGRTPEGQVKRVEYIHIVCKVQNRTKGGREVHEIVHGHGDTRVRLIVPHPKCSQEAGSQPPAVEDILYGSVYVPTRRLEGANIL